MLPLTHRDLPLSGRKLVAGSAFFLAWCVVFRDSLADLYRLALEDDGYSHILIVPFLSAYLVYEARTRIFHDGWTGVVLQRFLSLVLLAGGGVLFLAVCFRGGPELFVDALSVSMASAVLILLGAALILLPRIDLTQALLPAFLLLLLIPFPTPVREAVVSFLVKGSAFFTEALFRLTGTAYYREGSLFLLPGIGIEIADECSGLRSSIGLFITVLLASHFFLRKWWSKTALIVLVFPMVLIKNAIRITTLTLLALHVNKGFVENYALHRGGGVVFFAITLLLILPAILLLMRAEKQISRKHDQFR